MDLYHYYDRSVGPFVSISDLPPGQAETVLQSIVWDKPHVQSARRQPSYVRDRLFYEEILRNEFIKKGGTIRRHAPHYMVVEHSPWLSTWYENSAYIRIPIMEFDLSTVSFTYGDSHPVFSPIPRADDGKEYRRKLYTYEEILDLIDRYGLPQDWNDDGRHGPERYIEAHIWSDETIQRYLCP